MRRIFRDEFSAIRSKYVADLSISAVFGVEENLFWYQLDP